MRKVLFFALPPWRFWSRFRVGAPVDDTCNAVPKTPADLLQGGPSPLVLDRVVQQSRGRGLRGKCRKVQRGGEGTAES